MRAWPLATQREELAGDPGDDSFFANPKEDVPMRIATIVRHRPDHAPEELGQVDASTLTHARGQGTLRGSAPRALMTLLGPGWGDACFDVVLEAVTLERCQIAENGTTAILDGIGGWVGHALRFEYARQTATDDLRESALI